MKPYVITLLSILISSALHSEENVGTTHGDFPQQSSISITCDIPDAPVYINGDSVGITPLSIQATAGTHYVKVIHPLNYASWFDEPILDTITVEPGTGVTRNYEFKTVLLTSIPVGAQVFSKDSLLGTTPMALKTDLRQLVFRKEAYEDEVVSLGETGILSGSATLKRSWKDQTENSIFKNEEGNSSLHLYITGATTIIAGAASAYFKVKADNSYSQYVRTGNPSQLSEVNRLDTSAGIALVATQISLGLFTYFLLSE